MYIVRNKRIWVYAAMTEDAGWGNDAVMSSSIRIFRGSKVLMADDPEYEKGLQKAYRLLAFRARSERELRTRLKEKIFDGQVIDRVIARLYELNYLDDEAFARQWARRLAMDKLSGDRSIVISLEEKGVDRATCEQILAEIRQEVPEREAIRQVIQKRLKGKTLDRLDIRGKRSLVQCLLGRGFAPDLIFEMIKEAEEGNRDDDGQSDQRTIS